MRGRAGGCVRLEFVPWPPDVADALTRATVGPAVEALLLASANVDGTVRLWGIPLGE